MQGKELAAMTLTATLTAVLVAPLTMLCLLAFGVDGTLRTAIVAGVTASITTIVAARRFRQPTA